MLGHVNDIQEKDNVEPSICNICQILEITHIGTLTLLDGSMFKSLIGIGGCFRDEQGNWIIGFLKCVGMGNTL